MRISNLLWLSIAAAAPSLGQAGIFGSFWRSDEKKEEASNNTPTNSLTIHEIIHGERRHVLYNSRQLSGECLDICIPDRGDTDSPTPAKPDPTEDPTGFPTTEDPTGAPTTEDPTGAPTDSPSGSPTASPSGSPTASPSAGPTGGPTANPTANPTRNPTANPTGKPTGNPTANPTGNPTANPTGNPTANPTGNPTANPTRNPTGSPSARPTIRPTAEPSAEPSIGVTSENSSICVPSTITNLGEGFSDATGNPHYNKECYPAITGGPNWNNLPGRDDSVAVFVGGDYKGISAAEVEGNVVVMGDLTVEQNGPGNFVSVGVGTHVLPNSGGDCIIVGGNLVARRDIQVFNQRSHMKCDIVYKGSATNKYRWKTNGKVYHDANYDMSHYENMMKIWEKKSKYWGSLKETGTIYEKYTTTHIPCSKNDDIQVFNVWKGKRDVFSKATSYKFNSNCKGKTILINVHGDGHVKLNAAAMRDFNDRQGYGNGGFDTCFKSSIIWNFPKADNVDIGVGQYNSEWQGSILATGNLKMVTSGHSGRAIVLGDLTHQSNSGSEFHSYNFKPPFDLPDPDDICEPPAPTAPIAPTRAPTREPTKEPKLPDGCNTIPKSHLPNGKWPQSGCNKCVAGNSQNKYYPCNGGFCYGKDCVGPDVNPPYSPSE